MKEEVENKKELIKTDATANAVQVIKAAILTIFQQRTVCPRLRGTQRRAIQDCVFGTTGRLSENTG